ncbi:hypothetical protein KC318_g7685, partial [Hortaea werneckii]
MARERKTASLAGAAASSAPSSRTPSQNPSTVANRRSTRVAVANSSDTEDGSGDDIVVSNPNRRTLKEVSIPTMPRSIDEKVSPKPESASPTDSAAQSGGSTPRADSVYDTPGTTPATSIRGATNGNKRKASSLGRQVIAIEDSDEEMGDADEALARRLQEEEYARESGLANKKQKTNRFLVDDSEAYESELSDPPPTEPESEDEVPLSKRRNGKGVGHLKETRKPNNTKGNGQSAPVPNKGKKGAPPARAARQNARRSIGSSFRSKVEDSEEELEPLSDSDSGGDFVDEDSEAEEDHASEEESEAMAGASRDSTEAPSGPPARQSKKLGRGRKSAGRRRPRFGNYTAEGVTAAARDIEDVVAMSMMGRKERERKKLEKAHPQIKTMWDDLAKVEIIKPVAAGQPDSISRRLKPFQLEGLNWLVRQEKTPYKGGLLGDEMGMGKTIQAVSLIMSDYPQKDPTLVVVPPVA